MNRCSRTLGESWATGQGMMIPIRPHGWGTDLRKGGRDRDRRTTTRAAWLGILPDSDRSPRDRDPGPPHGSVGILPGSDVSAGRSACPLTRSVRPGNDAVSLPLPSDQGRRRPPGSIARPHSINPPRPRRVTPHPAARCTLTLTALRRCVTRHAVRNKRPGRTCNTRAARPGLFSMCRSATVQQSRCSAGHPEYAHPASWPRRTARRSWSEFARGRHSRSQCYRTRRPTHSE